MGAPGRCATKRLVADRRQEKAPLDGGQRGFSDRKLWRGAGALFPVHLRKTTTRAGLESGGSQQLGSLAMLAAMRRASSRVRLIARQAVRRGDMSEIRGRSGSARLAFVTTLMLRSRDI